MKAVVAQAPLERWPLRPPTGGMVGNARSPGRVPAPLRATFTPTRPRVGGRSGHRSKGTVRNASSAMWSHDHVRPRRTCQKRWLAPPHSTCAARAPLERWPLRPPTGGMVGSARSPARGPAPLRAKFTPTRPRVGGRSGHRSKGAARNASSAMWSYDHVRSSEERGVKSGGCSGTVGAVAASATDRWHGRKCAFTRTRAGSATRNVHADQAKGRWPNRLRSCVGGLRSPVSRRSFPMRMRGGRRGGRWWLGGRVVARRGLGWRWPGRGRGERRGGRGGR